MKVYGYCRVSTFEQANEGESLATQKRAVEGYAMMKGWEVATIFVEAGVSGSVSLVERPEGQRLLSNVVAGDIIITPKLDRMFRSAADALATLEECKTTGVQLHMLDLGGDVTGNGISKLVFTILSAVAENERDRLRERIREVKAHLKSEGVYGGGKRPYGYDVVDGRLVPNTVEQAMVATMIQMRDEGASLRKIGMVAGLPAMTVKRVLDRA